MSNMVLKVAVFGTGYWAGFQIPAWQSLGVEVVALWNRTRKKAEAMAQKFSTGPVYDTPEEVFENAEFDIADIIADVDAHEKLVLMAAACKKPVICQKPMSKDLDSCRRMVEACRDAGVWYAVHENFRFQPSIAAVKEALDSGAVGRPLRAHILLKSPDRPIMSKQPALTQMDHMALRDMGPHIFDVARYYFGDVEQIFSLPIVTYEDIGVQDSAASLLKMENGLVVQCDLVHDWEYRVFVKGTNGTLLLDRDNILHIKNAVGNKQIDTKTWRYLEYIPEDDWNIHGGHVFASIPACLNMLKESFLSGKEACTSGSDNFKTMATVFAAMCSWDEKRSIKLSEMGV